MKKIYLIFLAIFLGLTFGQAVFAADLPDYFEGYAWLGNASDGGQYANIGAISLSCTNTASCGLGQYGIKIEKDKIIEDRFVPLDGFFWIGGNTYLENMGVPIANSGTGGWVDMRPPSSNIPPASACEMPLDDSGDYTSFYDLEEERLVGFGRIRSLQLEGIKYGFDDWGWVSFCGNEYEVKYDYNIFQRLSGWAWSGGGTSGATGGEISLLDTGEIVGSSAIKVFAEFKGELYAAGKTGGDTGDVFKLVDGKWVAVADLTVSGFEAEGFENYTGSFANDRLFLVGNELSGWNKYSRFYFTDDGINWQSANPGGSMGSIEFENSGYGQPKICSNIDLGYYDLIALSCYQPDLNGDWSWVKYTNYGHYGGGYHQTIVQFKPNPSVDDLGLFLSSDAILYKFRFDFSPDPTLPGYLDVVFDAAWFDADFNPSGITDAQVYDNKLYLMVVGNYGASGFEQRIYYTADGYNWSEYDHLTMNGQKKDNHLFVADNKLYATITDYSGSVWSFDGVNWQVEHHNISRVTNFFDGIEYDDEIYYGATYYDGFSNGRVYKTQESAVIPEYNANLGLGWLKFYEYFNPATAYIQTLYGDVYARDDIIFPQENPPDQRGATFLILSTGEIVNFSTSQGGIIRCSADLECDQENGFVCGERGFCKPVGSDFDDWVLENYGTRVDLPSLGNNYYNLLGRLDVAGLITDVDSGKNKYGQEIIIDYDLVGEQVLNNAVYYYDSDLILNDLGVDDFITFNNGDFSGFEPVFGNGTIIVNGDLTINRDIYYQIVDNIENYQELASVAWIVLGDIIVDSEVTSLAGAFFALGNETGSEGSFKTGSSTTDFLAVNGLVMAKNFSFGRTFLNGWQPAEKFVYDPKLVLNPPPGLQETTSVLPSFFE